jgi:hypothetical protein
MPLCKEVLWVLLASFLSATCKLSWQALLAQVPNKIAACLLDFLLACLHPLVCVLLGWKTGNPKFPAICVLEFDKMEKFRFLGAGWM